MTVAARVLITAGCITFFSACNNARPPVRQFKVLAINSGWNPPFVVLNAGSQQGAKIGARLALQRNSQQIGELRVTSVEPSVCVADIVVGSIPPNTHVRPGDVAIFEMGMNL